MKFFKKRRPRKKYEVGEFSPKGIQLNIKFSQDFTAEEFDQNIDGLIDFLEEKHLTICGGGSHDYANHFVQKIIPIKRRPNGTIQFREVPPSETERMMIGSFLKKNFNKATSIEVSSIKSIDDWAEND